MRLVECSGAVGRGLYSRQGRGRVGIAADAWTVLRTGVLTHGLGGEATREAQRRAHVEEEAKVGAEEEAERH